MLTTLAAFVTFAVLLVDGRPTKLSASGIDTPPSYTPRIIGGQDAVDGQFPYMLELEYFGSVGWFHQCGAVLIRPFYALTAAKCVKTSNVINLRLFAGLLVRGNYTLTNAQQISINRVFVHPSYDELVSGQPNDIAVLELAWAADTSRPNIGLATLPPDDLNDFNHGGCTIMGWGRYSTDVALAFTLQYADNTVITNLECSERMQSVSNANIYETHVCSKSDPPGVAACQGDSGSPIMCGATETDLDPLYLVGVGSWTVLNQNYCNVNFPTVFTRVSKYLDWIAGITTPAA